MVMHKASEKLYRFLKWLNSLGGILPVIGLDKLYGSTIELALNSGLIIKVKNSYQITEKGLNYLRDLGLEEIQKNQIRTNKMLTYATLILGLIAFVNFIFELIRFIMDFGNKVKGGIVAAIFLFTPVIIIAILIIIIITRVGKIKDYD
ncbi:MAG: hypothetical protein AABY32_02745 [Nanoarchaeota archaeon]